MDYLKGLAVMCMLAWGQAHAAGFDCNQARSGIEKIVCSNQELSELDARLNEAYQTALKNQNESEHKALKDAQTSWLRKGRNQCADAACLVRTYQSRIDELDPFADNHLTCEKMQRFTQRIFEKPFSVERNVGVSFDHNCPESLTNQPFLQKLFLLAEEIRAEEGPRECTGSIVLDHANYYDLRWTHAGFFPQTLEPSPLATGAAMDWNAFLSASGNDRETAAPRYFKQWSEQSRYNFKKYDEFTREFSKALPQLAEHYEKKLGLPPEVARTSAKNAMYFVLNYAAGSFPLRLLQPENDLMRLVRSEYSTSADVQAALKGADAVRNRYSDPEVNQALRVALLNNRSPSMVAVLMEAISSTNLNRLNSDKEPLLSLSVGRLGNLEYLIEKKVPVDAENDFGKTALFYAIGSNNHRAVYKLLMAGARVDHTYKSARELRPPMELYPEGDPCIYPNLTHTKRTPLMHASQNSGVEMIKMILAAGARLDSVDDLGFNALDYAMLGNSKSNEAYLRALGLKSR